MWLQRGLDFLDSVRKIKQRGKDFITSNWYTTQSTIRELLAKYKKEHPLNPVSYGYFHLLKPFYIRHDTQKDLEMCVCKHHLHARWAVDALVTNARQQGIRNEINEFLIPPVPHK